MPKPFGKVARRGIGLTRGMKVVLAVWVGALPAYFLLRIPARGLPTLAEDALYWPAGLALGIFYAAMMARWFRRRPSPHAPGETSRTGLLVKRFIVSLLAMAPMGLLTSHLYGPAFTLVNGAASLGKDREEYAMVVREKDGPALDSPYWAPPFRFRVPPAGGAPQDIKAGSLAKLSLGRGLLGATFVRKIEYEALP